MKLLTVCVGDLAIVVLATDVEPALPDEFATNREVLSSLRFTNTLLESLPDDVRRVGCLQEVDEAIDTWLGEDLMTLRHKGALLWNGDRSRIVVRDPTDEEVTRWRTAHQLAVDTMEQDAGDDSYATFLIDVDGRNRTAPSPRGR